MLDVVYGIPRAGEKFRRTVTCTFPPYLAANAIDQLSFGHFLLQPVTPSPIRPGCGYATAVPGLVYCLADSGVLNLVSGIDALTWTSLN